MRWKAAFSVIKKVLDGRRINIWCVKEAIGSPTQPDRFMDLIDRAETESASKGFHATLASARPGHKRNSLSKWSSKDCDRLSEFLDRDNVPVGKLGSTGADRREKTS
jgi:hypothetical protein